MRDDWKRLLSRYMDGDLGPEDERYVESLLDGSGSAREYMSQLETLRRQVRYEPAASTTDVVPAVMASVATRPPQRPARLRAAAVFTAAVVAGAVFVGLAVDRPSSVAAANIPSRVLEAQTVIAALDANLEIVERGWHGEVPEREFAGTISYRAPETLVLQLTDKTMYPTPAWPGNELVSVVNDDLSWSEGIPGCPVWALPDCLPDAPRGIILEGRDPFPDGSDSLLDLVVPVNGFSRAAQPDVIGVDQIDGRTAVGVEVTVAQMAPLLDAITQSGHWRELHPTDQVELWLDAELLVPLALTVTPAQSDERRLWAIREGYRDSADVAIFEILWSDVSAAVGSVEVPTTPTQLPSVDVGFVDSEVSVPFDLTIPDGLEPHRSGILSSGGPEVFVATWSDGRAWLKVAWTTDWTVDKLFGGLGKLVRSSELGTGVGYLNERGDRVAIHGRELDVVVTGSLETSQLVEVAASVDIEGLPVPAEWEEAGTATLIDAKQALPGLMEMTDLEGYGPETISVNGDEVVQAFAGPGNRGFVLTQSPGDVLAPPLEAAVSGVAVGGTTARFSPNRGLLEWVEGGIVLNLESSTLSLSELVALTEMLRP